MKPGMNALLVVTLLGDLTGEILKAFRSGRRCSHAGTLRISSQSILDRLSPSSTVLPRGVAVVVAVLAGVQLTGCESETSTNPPPQANCIASGTQDAINQALTQVGSVAVLCQNAAFALTAPVVFARDSQQIYTEGFPTDDRRAVLAIASASVVTAVDMADRSHVVLRNVVVDGSRPTFGYQGGEALIRAGGSVAGQVVRNVKAYEPRSWSILHLFEGGNPNCSDAVVENNEFGPAGQSDGTWADGISFACSNSVVRNNVIVDATDGGIVIFAAPGSVIENNVIRAETRVLLGGINMVDYPVYGGDYTNTRVRNNVIDAAGAVIRIGVGMGWRVWVCFDPNSPDDPTIFGGVVTNNTLEGDHMQYGFAVDGVRDWTVTGNVDLATHSGTPTIECNGQMASPPAGFQFHSARADGVFQPEFAEAFVELALWAIESPQPAPMVGF